jgi:hypothetical protein
MDVERKLYKALLCDFPIEEVVIHLTSDNLSVDGEWFRDTLKKTLHDSEPSRNMQEIGALVDMYQEDWINQITPRHITSSMAGVFKFIKHCAELFLCEEDNELVCNKDHFLGWNIITRITGEDLLVCAWKGMVSTQVMTSFAWPDVIRCGGDVVKLIDQEKLCDIHAHLGGASDPFILNWISLMTGGFMEDRQFLQRGDTMQSLKKWSVLAARIRIAMYRRFILGQRDAFGRSFKTSLKEIMGSVDHFLDERNRTKDLADQIKNDGKLTSDHIYVDYAIHRECQDEQMRSPYMLWHGERKMLCEFFREYQTGSSEIKMIARYVYLYCLIKNSFKKEIMMTKRHRGLSYFSDFNNRRSSFVRSELKVLVRKYAYQTSIRPNGQDGVELRINPSPTELAEVKEERLNECIFTDGQWIDTVQTREVTYLIHFSKSVFQRGRDYAKGRAYVQQVLENELTQNPFFAGVDAAGEELICRPERLGHHYRYLCARGHRNFTYHVGEDFYDITDGLRAIDEAVVFLGVNRKWRLGHCVALGINNIRFYEKIEHQIYITKQMLLDNLVWLIKRSEEFKIVIPKSLKRSIVDKINELYSSIGYNVKFSLDSYYNSMWLRSDVQGQIRNTDIDHVAWEDSMRCGHKRCKKARKDNLAAEMAHAWRIRDVDGNNRDKPDVWKTTKAYESLVGKLQMKMLKMVSRLNVGIECNPTSNLILSNIERYDQHPLFRFRNVIPIIGSHLPVTINTDDKGLLATSLLNEFALMACAILKKEGWLWHRIWKEELAKKYLIDISKKGYDMRFNWNNNEYGTYQY